MTRKNLIAVTLILVLFGLALWVLIPLDSERLNRQGMRLGLDLVGGVHLVYRADFADNATASDKSFDMNRAVDTIERRINSLGVTEPIIQQQENERLVVQLPGFTDIEAAKQMVEKTGFLEFREVELNNQGNPVYLADYLSGNITSLINSYETGDRVFVLPPDRSLEDNQRSDQPPFIFLNQDEAGNLVFSDIEGTVLSPAETQAKLDESLADYLGSRAMLSWMPTRGNNGEQLIGAYLSEAQAVMPSAGINPEPVVSIKWNEEGAVMFDNIAARIYSAGPEGTPQRRLGIFLDSSLISSPQILRPEYGNSGYIEGGFSIQEAQDLATLLQSGSLPMPLEKPPLYEEKVSATLGADFIETSVLAGIIGIILVMLFMILYYRLPGFLASLSLLFYGAVVLAIFKLVPVTLTLAGIGGFVLSIGMAVDANVLIFERMREELRTGRTAGAAVEAGFNRAWTAIRDSNITTFIVCGILYWLGSSIVASAPVMGFAVTLFIGVAVSMFSAIVVTRTLLRLTIHTSLAQQTSLFIKDTGKKQ